MYRFHDNHGGHGGHGGQGGHAGYAGHGGHGGRKRKGGSAPTILNETMAIVIIPCVLWSLCLVRQLLE